MSRPSDPGKGDARMGAGIGKQEQAITGKQPDSNAAKPPTCTSTRAHGQFAPGLHFVVVRHDDDCPMLLPTPGECTCSPTVEELPEVEFTRIVTADLLKRRAVAAAREVVERMRKGVQ